MRHPNLRRASNVIREYRTKTRATSNLVPHGRYFKRRYPSSNPAGGVRTVLSEPSMPRCVTVAGSFSTFRQKCCGSRRLAGGASESEMTSTDKSPSPERASRREAGGGCPPPPNCTCPSNSRCGDSPNLDRSSSVTSSCCPSRCEGHSSPRASSCCQPCASPLRPILKKKYSCCCDRCSGPSPSCMCQPMPRGCNCPPPVQVDARAARECTCDCPSGSECACPPSERRFPRTTRTCPNARLCRPCPHSPPKCHNNCTRYQPCLPPPCDSCVSSECCRAPAPVAPKKPCGSCSPCPSCSPCRPASFTGSSCRPPTLCRKLSICDERRGASCLGTGQSCCGSNDAACSERDGVEEREIQTSDTEDRNDSCGHCCATDRGEPEEQSECVDDSRDSIPDEGSVEDSTSKTSVDPPADSSREPVGPDDPTDAPARTRVEYAVESAEVLERPDGDKFTNESQRASPPSSPPPHVPLNDHAKSDALHPLHPSVGKSILRSLARARLLSRAAGSPARLKRQNLSAANELSPGGVVVFDDDSPRARDARSAGVSVNISTASTRANDRRRGGGGTSAGNSGGLSREIRVIRWNLSSPPVTRDRSASASLRPTAVVYSRRESTRSHPLVASQGDRR